MTALETTQTIPLTKLNDGTIIVTGTPIALEIVVARHNAGDTPDEIKRGFPSLDLADIYFVVAYYLSHRAEVDTYIQGQQERSERVRQWLESDESYRVQMADLRERMNAFRDAEEINQTSLNS
ncbi:MAG: DUF433 domain-containing protein [Blastocatellia bacterium]